MAVFTRSVIDILKEYHPDLDIRRPYDVRQAAEDSLLPSTISLQNYINPEYVDAFVLGFVYHYLYEELGIDTLYAWQGAYIEKVINNGEFINQVFANLDKNVYSRYAVTETEGSNKNDRSLSSVGNTESNATESDANLQASQRGTNDKETVSDIRLDAEGYKHEGSRGSSDADERSAITNNNSNESGSEITNQAEAEKSENHETNNNSQTDTESSITSKQDVSSSVDNKDDWVLYSDTPQNGLTDVKNGRYLTNAQNNTANDTSASQSSGNESGASQRVSTGGGGKDNNTDTSKSGTDQKAHQSMSDGTETSGESSVSQHSEHDDTADERSKISQGGQSKIGENNAVESQTGASAKVSADKRDDTHAEVSSEAGAQQGKSKSYETTYDLISQADSLMSRIWSVFDDLFMGVYGNYEY